MQNDFVAKASATIDAPAAKVRSALTTTIELLGSDNKTDISLSQNNNSTEEAREHSQKNWEMMLSGLKKVVEE